MENDYETLQEENRRLEQENAALRTLIAELLPLREQVQVLSEKVKQLENQKAKDSHNSHLPPSSDRFHRQPKTASGKKGRRKQNAAQICSSDCSTMRRRYWLSARTSRFLLIIVRPSMTCAWSKCSRKSLAASAVSLEQRPFVAFAAIFPVCASKGCICSRLWNKLWLVIRFFSL